MINESRTCCDNGKVWLAIHPGGILKDELVARRWSAKKLSDKADLKLEIINEILNNERDIDVAIAMKLSIALGTSMALWMNLQDLYDTNKPKVLTDTNRIEKLEARVAELEKKLKFREHLQYSSDIVKSWPQWKQDVLGKTHPAPDADTPPVNWERCEELASKLTTPAPDADTQAEFSNEEIENVLNAWSNGDYKNNDFNENACCGAEEKMLRIIKYLYEKLNPIECRCESSLNVDDTTPAPPAEWKPEVGDWVVLMGKIIDSKMSAYLDNERLYQVQIATDKSPSRYNTDWYHPDDLRPIRNSEEE